ncbi:TetR/AcrR family transcriptional regulator [Conexibacter sp. S30A1]|uniref:TetR/AcrR family transcriptional regulator n=1 Tax=Conexibacter sp. S30A1 TaxID=2937800 RepID=UPI00200F4E7B|nr:TetR/AcrR family transcriptional regulator [Conexibacter sp. S30A1]
MREWARVTLVYEPASEPSVDRQPSAGRRQRQRERMRERLLSAALELFAVQGFAETTIDQIAERADVARQTVLNHFPHKADFARAWGQARRDQLGAIGDHADPDESASLLVKRHFQALAEFNQSERELTRALLSSLTPTEVFNVISAVPPTVIERGRRQGEFAASVDPVAAADVLTSVYFGTISRWLSHGSAPFELSQVLDEHLELVLAGLRQR